MTRVPPKFDFYPADEAWEMATESDSTTMSTQREIDHETDEQATSENVLATLSEEQKHHVQMQKLREMTVEPGLLYIPVKRVTTAENSPKYAVELDHPVIDPTDTRMYFDQPAERGWTEDYDIVRILDWYTGSENPYHLQMHNVYARYHEDDDEWEIVEQPEDPGRIGSAWSTVRDYATGVLPRWEYSIMGVANMALVGAFAFGAAAGGFPWYAGALFGMFLATIAVAVLVEPPNGVDDD